MLLDDEDFEDVEESLIPEDDNDPNKLPFKRQVVAIIEEKQKAIHKNSIVRKFASINNIDLDDANDRVVTALSNLSRNNEIIGYKPDTFKVKGFFWTLPSWWENNQLKDEYKPLKPALNG